MCDNNDSHQRVVSDASAPWPFTEEKQFELALVEFPEDVPDRWLRIADLIGRKAEEVKIHYDELVRDVMDIESGKIPLPVYPDDEQSPQSNQIVSSRNSVNRDQRTEPPRKGRSWTEEEHRWFLLGLQKCGKGDWRSISRNYVITRNPSQVASHAQKYFIRLNTAPRTGRKKRSSIHDIHDPIPPTMAPGHDPIANNVNMETLSIQDSGVTDDLALGPAPIPTHLNMDMISIYGLGDFDTSAWDFAPGDVNMVTTQSSFSNQDGYQLPVSGDVNIVITQSSFSNQDGYQIPVSDSGDVNISTHPSRFSNHDEYMINYNHPCSLQ